MKNYRELSLLKTFDARFAYLRLHGSIGHTSFGGSRWINQRFYKSAHYLSVRDEVIIRDQGCDLGLPGYEIGQKDKIIIHHIQPLTKEDLLTNSPACLSLDNLICVSAATHNAIHYGATGCFKPTPVERTQGDTTLWRYV